MKQAKIILPPLLLNRQLRLAYYPRVIYQLSRAVVSAGYCAQRWPIAGGSEADSGALSAHESAVAKPSKRCLCQAQETHDFLGCKPVAHTIRLLVGEIPDRQITSLWQVPADSRGRPTVVRNHDCGLSRRTLAASAACQGEHVPIQGIPASIAPC